MRKTTIQSPYALIGDNLELKKKVSLELDKDGIITDLSHEEPEDNIQPLQMNQSTLMIPGLINSHVHIGDSFAKEKGFNKDLSEIVAPPFGLKHKLLRQTPEEFILTGITKAAKEMLSNGITCFVDFREGGVAGVDLLKKGLAQISINCLIYGRFRDESEIEQIFEMADGVGLPSYKQITRNNTKLVIASKQKTNKMIACHCAENIRDINLIESVFNDNLVDIFIHGTKFNRKDLTKLKEEAKPLVLCPRCNAYFGVGFPPIPEILRLEIPVSLGTDNVMLNSPDLFEEMRYLYRISRVLGSHDKSIQLTSKDLLKMITINAARNFKVANKIGSLSVGKRADFFLIDLEGPNYYTNELNKDKIFDIIVQRTKSENIVKTYIKGEAVFERN